MTGPAPATDTGGGPPRGLRDRGVGIVAAFTAATLLMVVAIIVLASVDSWWVLVPVMLVDFAATFGVLRGITRLLSDDGD